MEENRENIREKNLIPFKKGESGNPNGRPLGQKNYSTLYKEALIRLGQLNDKTPDELELELISSGFTNARKGDYRFYKDVLDRIHGQAMQKTDITTGGMPIIQISEAIVNKNASITSSPEQNS